MAKLQEFFQHYFEGSGSTVDLADVGLLDTIKAASSSGVESCKAEAIQKVTQIGDYSCYEGNITGACQNRIVNATSYIYAVGHTTLQGSYSCQIHRDTCPYRYACRLDFNINDWFIDALDPFDIFSEPDLDVPGSAPYPIIASWQDHISGTGGYLYWPY